MLTPDDTWLITMARVAINDQFSSMASLCFAGGLDKEVKPYSSIDAIWRVYDNLWGTKVQAIVGSRFMALAAIGQLSLSG